MVMCFVTNKWVGSDTAIHFVTGNQDTRSVTTLFAWGSTNPLLHWGFTITYYALPVQQYAESARHLSVRRVKHGDEYTCHISSTGSGTVSIALCILPSSSTMIAW